MQEREWYFTDKFLTSNSVMLHENKDTSLDVLFIQVVIDSIYVNFIFFACWGLYKSQFQLIVSSKLVIKILSLIYYRYFVIVDRSHIVRKTFLNESFAKFKISRSLVLLS